MIERTDNCVGCTEMGLPCKGNSCSNYYIQEMVVCDECGKSGRPIYDDGEKNQLCAKCLARKFKGQFIEEYFDQILDDYAEIFAESFKEVTV